MNALALELDDVASAAVCQSQYLHGVSSVLVDMLFPTTRSRIGLTSQPQGQLHL